VVYYYPLTISTPMFLSIIRCALIDDYVAYYLPIGCRRHDLVRSFTTLTKLLTISRWLPFLTLDSAF
jgi:hypothetical protein